MAYTWAEKLITIKIETVYGADATPTGAANAIKTLNGQITPVEGDEVTLDVDYPGLGAPEAALAGQHVSGSFDVALCGSGDAGEAPSWGAVLRMCGFAETITADTDVTYTPIQTGHESATIYITLKGAVHKVLGARGKLSIAANAKNWMLATVNFRGLLVPVATASGSLPAATFAPATELLVSDANSAFTIDGHAGVMSEFTLDMGSDPAGRFLVGSESVELPDPVPVGTVSITDPGVAVKNFFTVADARTKVALSFTHGTVAGNIVEITAPAVQVGPKITYAEVERYRHLSIPLRFTRHEDGPLAIVVK